MALDQSFTPIGTYIPVNIEKIFDQLVVDGAFTDRRNGTFMEMDAYSAYLALKAVDDGGEANRAARQRIVSIIEARRQACGGFWSHGVWAPEVGEIHLRFTAAALRLLIEAHVDGLYPDVAGLVTILKKHLAFMENIEFGPWFLHDSLECPEFAAFAAEKPLPNALWGSSIGNCLVLNTHVDTLLTLIDAIERVDLAEDDRQALSSLAEAAMGTLDKVLNASPPWWWPVFAKVDSLARGFLLRNPKPTRRIVNIFKWKVVIGFYFKNRRTVKSRAASFVFEDGYLERDLSLLGYFLDYHIYNLHDLMRLVRISGGSSSIMSFGLRERIIAIVDRAIDYACRAPYRDYVLESTRENGRAAILAEAIIARRHLSPELAMPQDWADMLERISGLVAPTPAMLGYDPFILPRPDARPVPQAVRV